METPTTPTPTLTRISKRRAGEIRENHLIIYRLRRPNKAGVQKIRDIVKNLEFSSPAEATTALQLKIKEAESRALLSPEEEKEI